MMVDEKERDEERDEERKKRRLVHKSAKVSNSQEE